MPYIAPERRGELAKFERPETAGELNFLITMYILDYILLQGESYETYCAIEGVLSHISKELYRRRVEPYEDKKIKQNGDVYCEEMR